MTDTSGRSIRVFLVDGNPSGLVTGEIVNWTGHVLIGPRTRLTEMLKRPEAIGTGLYILFGSDPEQGASLDSIYVGETDSIGQRLRTHNSRDDKKFWERTCVITSKDSNLTKAHVRFIERQLVALAKNGGRVDVTNGNSPGGAILPEGDASDMAYFIDQLRMILPVLGMEFFKQQKRVSGTANDTSTPFRDEQSSPIFEMKVPKSPAIASGQEIDGEFVLLKGSNLRSEWLTKRSEDHPYARLHNTVFRSSAVTLLDDELAVLSEDVHFSSPSAASAMVAGRPDNGRTSWRIPATGMTYADWTKEEVEKVAQAHDFSDET